jgi:hypothetical protein
MSPIHIPFGTGCAKKRKISIFKTVVGVEVQEKVGDFERLSILV